MSLFDESVPSSLLDKYAPAKWAAKKEGIILLFAADPDFRVAPEIREAAAAAAADGVYARAHGGSENKAMASNPHAN